jgi:tetratricopeptide (TPR) repeat protein
VLRLATIVLPLSLAASAASAAGDRAAAAALAAQAEIEAARGDLAAAIRTLESAEKAAPEWAELKVNLAALRSRAGDFQGAIDAARAALALAPTLEGARINLGLAQLKAGDAAGANATLDPYRGRADVPVPVLVAIGLAAAALAHPADSAHELGRAVVAGVRDPGVLYALARARREVGDAEGAHQAGELLRTGSPDSAARHMIDGDAADAGHDWDGAEAAYRRALAADDRFPGAHYSLGLVLFKKRAYESALEELDRELSLQPRYAPALYYRAVIELDRGRPQDAIPALQQAVAAAPGMMEAWRDLGRALVESGDGAGATGALERAVSLDARDPRSYFLLSRALDLAGRKVDAQEARRRATELNRQLRQELKDKVSGPPER